MCDCCTVERIRSWLGLDRPQKKTEEHGALRDLLDALEHMDGEQARYLAQFAYLLGRVAHADQHVSPEETRMMESLVQDEGDMPAEQAMLVVGLAKTNTLLFGGTDDFLVARDFASRATREQKLALVRCLFALSAVEGNISLAEEREIQRISRELRLESADILAIRLEYRDHLPGLSDRASS
jgi:uncharacterized tellurite resistance protein B-like protein